MHLEKITHKLNEDRPSQRMGRPRISLMSFVVYSIIKVLVRNPLQKDKGIRVWDIYR